MTKWAKGLTGLDLIHHYLPSQTVAGILSTLSEAFYRCTNKQRNLVKRSLPKFVPELFGSQLDSDQAMEQVILGSAKESNPKHISP
ncbi:MAG: hypothetical protein UT01_C0011G0014 [Candidatus Daviesbacteria bacterium GW2011_GWA1_38_7]|nr:MAG: hypothetical protein UT01_C0011G0014 [Candidatus Daviesbacteria bacterium GW2011_GWA1_38_7]